MKCLPAYLCGVAALALLTGCGQKGPLVLPDAPKTKHTLPAVPGLRRPVPQQSPVPPPAAPAQAPDDAAPVPQAPATPSTTSPR